MRCWCRYQDSNVVQRREVATPIIILDTSNMMKLEEMEKSIDKV